MDWSGFIPPANLLEKAQGVERGLRQYQRLGRFGWLLGAAAVVFQLTLVIVPILRPSVKDFIPWLSPVVLAIVVFAVIAAIVTRIFIRLRLQDAQQPFRYTCSVTLFNPGPATQKEERLTWLSEDLAQKLSERIPRLSFFDPDEEQKRKDKLTESHIHISGLYVIREAREPVHEGDRKPSERIEIMPRVRVGSMDSADTLAHPVTFPWRLPSEESSSGTGSSKESRSGDRPSEEPPTEAKSPPLTRDRYDRLLERVYFTVVSKLYQQIRKDVERKIELLPTSYARAVALFHEAQDYARSNTLNGYEDAGELFLRAATLLDISLRVPPSSGIRCSLFHLRLGLAKRVRGARCYVAQWFPAFGRREILSARARTGHATMQAYRRSLAALSGHRANPIFNAKRIAEETGKRIDDPRLREAPDWKECRFDAYVAEALLLALLGDRPKARDLLAKARGLDPDRAEKDPRYFYARGKSEAVPADRLDNLRRSINLMEERFDVALFDLAWATDLEWRRTADLEKLSTRFVLDRYDEVTEVNPANIQAWANRGYLAWLMTKPDVADGLADASAAHENGLDYKEIARTAYDNGLDYKEIARDTIVSELRFGLARISAEAGAFEQAYWHCLQAIPEKLSEGVMWRPTEYTDFYFTGINKKIVERFERFKDRVAAQRETWEKNHPDARIAYRTVVAFALNDYGMACYNYYIRTGDLEYQRKAVAALEEAVECDEGFVLAHYNLSQLYTGEDVDQCHDKVEELAPNWIDGKLARLRRCADVIRSSRNEAVELEAKRAELEREVEKLAKDAQDLQGIQAQADGHLKRSETQRQTLAAEPRFVGSGPDQIAASLGLSKGGKDGNLGTGAAIHSSAALPTGRPSDAAAEDSWRRIGNLSAMRATKDEARGKAEDEIASLRSEIERSRKAANDAAMAARDLLTQVVPHDWLYTTIGGRREFRAQVLHDPTLRSERRWERQLDDLHVTALIRFAAVLERERGPGGADPVALLELIRDCYYPSDFEVLSLAREFTQEGLHLRWERDFLRVLKEELQAEPGHFAALTWVTTSDLSAEAELYSERVRLLEQARAVDLALRHPASFLSVLSIVEHLKEAEDALRGKRLQLDDELREERVRLLEQGRDAGISQQNPGVILHVAEQLKYLARQCAASAAARPASAAGLVAANGAAAKDIWGGVLHALYEARKIEAKQKPLVNGWKYRQEIALAHWARGEFHQALNAIEATVPWPEPITPGAIEEIVAELSNVSSAPEDMARLREWLEDRKTALLRSGDEFGWNETQRATFALRRYAAPSQSIPAGDHPVLWLHREAIGAERESIASFERTFSQNIQRIRNEFCFFSDVPLLRISEALPERMYALNIANTSITGRIVPRGFFCPYPHSLETRFRDSIEFFPFAFNPASNIEDGVWLTDNDLIDKLAGRGYELWHRHDYICQHARSGILHHLGDLVSYETITRLLEELEQSEQENLRLAARRLRDPSAEAHAALTQFIRLIRTVARDKVSTPDLAVPLQIFTELSQRDCDIIVIGEEIRRQREIASQGNRTPTHRVRLSDASLAELAAYVENQKAQGGKERPIVLPRNLAGSLVRELERQGRAAGPSAILSVPQRELRPYLARLTEVYFPRVTVLVEPGRSEPMREAAQ